MARRQRGDGTRIGTFARRTFLLGSVAIAGGVAIGVWKYKTPHGNPLEGELDEGEAALTPYVKINAVGVTIITPRAEMGQGIHSTLAALVAEELDMAWEDVRVEHGPPGKAYYNGAVLEEGVPYAATDHSDGAERMRAIMKGLGKVVALQITGGSSSIPDGFMKMRLAGAAARQALIEAAAKRLGVSANDLGTQDGAVVTKDGQRIAYTDLALEAAQVELKRKPKLKPKSEWRYLGKSMPRLDMVSKSTGTAQFSIDVRLPNMLFASVKMGPHILYPIKKYDASKAETMPGVKKIIKIPDGVAVLATNTWNAMQAAKTIRVDYDAPAYPLTSAGQFEALAQSFEMDMDSETANKGDIETALSGGDVTTREYKVPYLAHATMEPMNATALLKNGRLDVWAGNQLPTQIVKEAKAITKLTEENIYVHTTLMGGGFGRRGEMDYIKQVIHIAKAAEGTPVKLTFSRENDIQYDAYRPLAMARFKGKLNGKKLVALDSQYAAPSIATSQFGRLGMTMPGPDVTIVQSAWDQPYDFTDFRVRGYRPPVMMPIGSWRSVGASQNAFFLESMIDEMAHEAGVDSLEFRLSHMNHEPSRAVLEKVAAMSEWSRALPPNRARGVAFCLSFGVPTAEVIELLQTDDGIKIDKAFAAVDVGTALDPRNIEAQVFGAMNFGLAAAMTSEITVANGYVEQSNFHDYDSLRMYQAPSVEVAILENGEKVRGIGEPGTPPAAPALANAVFALTGKRIRELPLRKHVKFI